MIRKILLLASLCGLLTGCALPNIEPTSTPFPPGYIQTAVALTGQSVFATSDALTPTAFVPTETPTVTGDAPTLEATITPTPPPKSPYGQIRFLKPGADSKIISPLELQMIIASGESEVVQIDLYGEDGRLLARVVRRIKRDSYGVYDALKIPFEIRAAAEVGLLQVITTDEEGRLQAVNTLQVILMSSGVDEITPAGNLIYERAVIYKPALREDMVYGGVLNVEGRMWPYDEPDHAFFIEFILPDGKTQGTRVITIAGMEPQEFSTTLPYKVDKPTLARLTVRQMSSLLKTPIYIYTQPVILNP